MHRHPQTTLQAIVRAVSGVALLVGAWLLAALDAPQAVSSLAPVLAVAGMFLVAQSRFKWAVTGVLACVLFAAGLYVGVIDPRHGSEVLGYPLMLLGAGLLAFVVRRRFFPHPT